VPLDPRGQQHFLRTEVVIDPSGTWGQPGGGLDLHDAGPLETMLTKEAHRLIEDAIPGRS
jgi:hypothetical protein